MINSRILYRADGVPAMQNRLFGTRENALSAPSASLELRQDDTGLVYNRSFDSTLITYDNSYQNDQSYSTQFRRHLDSICDLCCSYLTGTDSLVVDVGCGKGSFVELLRGRGVNAIGYDKAYQGDSSYIKRDFFSHESHDRGDLLILRHVLEHIPSPWQFLDNIAAANEYQGLLYIEVPDLGWILENRAYFDLFHEHVNYFRAEDFLQRFGQALVYQSKSFDDQYISVIIDLQDLRNATSYKTLESSDSSLVKAFKKLCEHKDYAYASLAASNEFVIWGAAAKGVAFAAEAPLKIRERIAYAIDISPRKQNRFMPVSGIEVLDPANGVARLSKSTLVVIMNPAYEREIKDLLPCGQPYLLAS